ncbi:MAG: ATP-binding cassette domain-containing protein, partial [Anaerolineaceae bacterium]|nr:ATP-binding cassette domain-containing protein [Anaerolineaceae bacterium]
MKLKKQIEEEVEVIPVTDPDVLLSIQNLHEWFELRKFGFGHAGYVRAVDGVSFNLKRGEAVAVVGESGCGKTSLMKTILGLYQPTRGNIIYELETRKPAPPDPVWKVVLKIFLNLFLTTIIVGILIGGLSFILQAGGKTLGAFFIYAGSAIALIGLVLGVFKSLYYLRKRARALEYYDEKVSNRKLINLKDFDRLNLEEYHAQVGYVQQDPYGALPPFMTIKKIMEEPLIINGVKSKKERLERIHKAFEEVKMTPVEEFLPKFPHMLSGGQQQRVVIARAMILNPRFLVADEPVSMLDASVRVEILKLLRALQEDHDLAVIYITHDLSTVRYFSEYIFVMYAGEVIEKAKVDDLIYHAKHPYTWALLSATSDPDAKNV